MKLLQTFKADTKNYPFVYSAEFKNFIKNNENRQLFYFVEENNGVSIVVKQWKAKIIKLVQILHPPLDANGKRISALDESIFLNKLVTTIKINKLADRILQPENFAIFKSTPENSIHVPFGTYYLDLAASSEETLFKNLHGKHRNVIRNAEKNNVKLQYGKKELEAFYVLFKQTMQRSDMYCHSYQYFSALYDCMEGNVICGVAYHNEVPQGALFIVYSEHAAYYLYGASAAKMSVNGAMNFLHWNTIKLLKNQNVVRYDFVGARLGDISGTKLEGIQQFKSRFGANLEKGFLWKQDINLTRCYLFDTLLKLKAKLSGKKLPKDIIDQELEKLTE